MIRSRFTILLIACLTTSCTSSQGLHTDQLRNIIQREETRFVGSHQSNPPIASALRSTAPALGLYLKPTGFRQREFDWIDRDRDTVLAWARELQSVGVTRSSAFVPQTSLKGDTLAELNASAIRYGIDLLVIFDGAAAVDRYNNYKAPLLYWTILGAYLADGTQSDALCLVKGSVWDAKTGMLLFSEETEGRSALVGPAAFVNDDQVILTARQQAVGKLLELIGQKLREMTTHPSTRPQ
jgi:hypothetical protein